MNIEINLKIILIFILFILINKIDIYTIFLIFIIAHEIVHAITGILLGFKPKAFKLNPLGVVVEFHNTDTQNKMKKILIYLSGPMFNIVLGILFMYMNLNSEIKIKLIYTNLILGIFNLIPILPLDGGKIFKEILTYFIDNKRANSFMIKATKIILIFFTLIYSITILKIKNIAIFLLIIYLWYLYFVEKRKIKMVSKLYNAVSKNFI